MTVDTARPTEARLCTDVRQRLTERLDAELPPDDAPAVEAHLSGCAACRQAWEELAAVPHMAALWAIPETPDLWPALAAQVTPAPWDAVLGELHMLRAELAELRRELAARSASPPSPRLFPHSTSSSARRLV